MADQTVRFDERPTPAGGEGATMKAWPRLAYMLAFGVIGAVAQNILYLVALLQVLWLLVAKAPNSRLTRFAESLGLWQRDVAAYQGCATETRPFPWSEWPTPRN